MLTTVLIYQPLREHRRKFINMNEFHNSVSKVNVDLYSALT